VLGANPHLDGPLERGSDAASRLRELESVTDTALGHLAVADLLVELLRRVRAILDADTAAVLLLDGSGRQLVATAACGLEEEVREGVHVPVGQGFAGRIAALKRPVFLTRVDETTVANPILWEKGICVMLGVPLLAEDEVVGVLHVGRLRNEPFDAHDQELLEVAAERVAGATQRRRLAVEQAAASLLERSLLPERLPAPDGLELATRYITPEDRAVGGDWYDVFPGPDGRIWTVVGDVAGHGLASAVVMGRVRSALRAYTLIDERPEKVLELTDRKVHHFEVGTMVTVICATSVPPYDTWQIATAGHPPPVIATGQAATSVATVPVHPPLGAAHDVIRSSTTVSLAPGDLMLLYTDGLIERRDQSLSTGLQRLCDALRAGTAEMACSRVVHTLIGPQGPVDDVALLAIRRTAASIDGD
jgi:serine phosphatase RsbU (regulator of sigma subunit)